MEVVDNFPHKALRDYYETWYRPDQQGIIVVGDIDVDRIEKKIKEMFSPIKMPENAPAREYEEVPDTEGTIYAVGKDTEMQYPVFNLFFKTEVFPREMRNSMPYMAVSYVNTMIGNMLSNRLQEMQSNPETPFAQAYANYDNYLLSSTEDALSLGAVGKGNDIIPSVKSVYRELLRAVRGGFTITEYDRARNEYLSQLENVYNNRDKVQNETYAKEIVRYFIDNKPMPGIETEYNMMNLLANQIPVDAINQTLKQYVTPDNRVMLVMLPDKAEMAVPTEAQLAQAMKEVDGETIEAFVDEVKAEPLIPTLPTPGKIVSEQPLEQWGATRLVLSNGVNVVVKHTDFKADEILFNAQALGGTSVIPDSYANSLILFDNMADMAGGLGDYTNKDLQKYMQGKQASVGMEFDDYTRNISGSTTPKDLPTLMELLYMHFTGFNIDETTFEATQKMLEGILKNQENNPQFIFGQKLLETLYANPRKRVATVATVEAADRQQIIDIARQLTANAADYTFFFVGNIDMNTFRPLVEQYIATLPADAAKATKAPQFTESLAIKPGDKQLSYTTTMQTPQIFAAVMEYGKDKFTPTNRALASVAGQILSKRLLDTVREEMGAVYSIWANGNMDRIDPYENMVIQSVFPMKPEKKQEVLDFIAQEFKNMETNVTTEELAKVIEFSLKNAKENLERNEAWLNGMLGEALNGVDTFNNAEETYRNITVDDVQNFMKGLNKQGNYRVIMLEPAPTTK